MADTSKLNSRDAPLGDGGERLLAAGRDVALRMWVETPADTGGKETSTREYEVVGYVVSGRAELTLDARTVTLEPGDSWLVPAGAPHTYKVLELFTAVEATSPPAHRR